MENNTKGGISAPAEQETAWTAVRPLETIRDEITASQEKGERAYLEIGRLLLEAKSRFFDRGKWLAWLEGNTDFSPRTAQRLMRVASYFTGDATPVSQLNVSKAYILCRLPANEVDDFLRNSHHVGRSPPKKVAQMTKRELEQAVRQHLAAKRKEPSARSAESSAAPSKTVQGQIERLRKDLSDLSMLVNDSKGTSSLNEAMTEELCRLCGDIMRQLAPDLEDGFLA